MGHLDLPLFRFPVAAGFKENTTSRDAAEAIEKSGKAGRLRDRTRKLFAMGFVGTADEAAEWLGEHPLAIRPRCSELHLTGFLKKTGNRRASIEGGRMSHEWCKA